MAVFELPTLDKDMLDDLMEEIRLLYETSEQTLIELEQNPSDYELQRALFRAIHTIKGDLGLVSFDPIIPLVSTVEDLLDYLRNGKITYSNIMSDLVLLTMDKVEHFVETVIQQQYIEYDEELFAQLVTQVKKVTPENRQHHDALLTEAVLLLDPSLKVDQEQEQYLPKVDHTIEKELIDDLEFFRELMRPIERRSRFWLNRGDRTAKLCVYINKLAGKPIPEEQLIAACYVHDFGMAFISHELLHKDGQLTSDELSKIRAHVDGSAQLLKHLPKWQEALTIVMQHHERCDGSGYPHGLVADEICDGAKLLAIVNSFDALTHERAHAHHTKRPFRRAAIELNADSPRLFDQKWIDYFNQAMRSIIKAK